MDSVVSVKPASTYRWEGPMPGEACTHPHCVSYVPVIRFVYGPLTRLHYLFRGKEDADGTRSNLLNRSLYPYSSRRSRKCAGGVPLRKTQVRAEETRERVFL